MEKLVYFFFLGAICLSVCGFVTMATSNNSNSNSTPEDTVIVTEPTPTPVKQTTMAEKIVVEPEPQEDPYLKAKERQQQEDLEELNKPDKVKETSILEEAPIPETQEKPILKEEKPKLAPLHREGVVSARGYVYVGVENAGRKVIVESLN
jgi:hypothetical protein